MNRLTVGNWILMVVLLLISGARMAAEAKGADGAAVLSDRGQRLLERYAVMRKNLQEELTGVVPHIDAGKSEAFRAAREAVKKARADAKSAQAPFDRIKAAEGAVGHAKGKWIGGAEKGIAEAGARLKKAATDAERNAAQADLAKWQKNREDGLKALKERQAVLDAARADEEKCAESRTAAQVALVAAEARELEAAEDILAGLRTFLSSDGHDASLVKCAVIAQATPNGLACFAQQGDEQAALVDRLLDDPALMKNMLEAGGARGGRYGQAMQIYTGITAASSRVHEGVLHRLALGTSVELALPRKLRNAVAETHAPASVDPVKRYLHYEKAYLDGELDPAFKDMSAWECRMIVNSDAPDHILAWGRETLRNYRPDHIFNEDYGWRYSGFVRTDVAYKHSQEYKDTDTLGFFQNVLKNGGICGRRGFFGRYICKSFGIPTWGVAQHAHCALGRWTPSGWVVNFGAGWEHSWGPPEGVEPGRKGTDFVLEAQARAYPDDHIRVLRAQWVGDMLGEERYDSTKDGSGGLWNVLALFEKKIIVARAKAQQLAALGTELGEANESAEAKAEAVAKAAVTDADRTIVKRDDGVIMIPAAACKGGQLIRSYPGGQQMIYGGNVTCAISVLQAGTYALAARVVTVGEEQIIQVRVDNGDVREIDIPYTCGMWDTTKPVAISLAEGMNTLSFSKPERSFALKEFTLTPIK